MDALSLLGSGASNAGSQNALDALSAFGQNGPKMPDFSGAQFGGQNNPAFSAATNPFSMSGAAGAAASKLPTMGGPGSQGAGGGIAGLSGSINKLIASNSKLTAAINKLAGVMGRQGGGGRGQGLGGLGGGGAAQQDFGLFEQLNLQKRQGASGGGGGSRDTDPQDGPEDAPKGSSKVASPLIGLGAVLFGAGAANTPDRFRIPNPFPFGPKYLVDEKIPHVKALRKLGGISIDAGMHMLGIGNMGAGTSMASILSSVPFGLGTRAAQAASVLENRGNQMVNIERLAFRTGAAIGGFGGTSSMVNLARGGTLADQYGYSPEMALENVLDVYTSGGFRTDTIGGTGRDALEKSFSVNDIFRFKNVGFGSTVLGGIQELFSRGSGVRSLFASPTDVARFGAGYKLGARGMNVLAEAMRSFGQQSNMFGMDTAGSSRLFSELIGFENTANVPVSFKGHTNALNRGFMTHQTMFQSTATGIQGLFGGLADNMAMAMDVRQARQNLGAGASGVAIMREANKIARNRTPQQKVAQMRQMGLSEDVIQARLLGEGLDEDQIQYALGDTARLGDREIALRIAAGEVAVSSISPKSPISGATAKGEFERVKQTYKNITSVTAVIEGNNKLQKQLFDNATAVKDLSKNVLRLNKFFEATSGDSLNTVFSTVNLLIKAINDITGKKGKNKLPSI